MKRIAWYTAVVLLTLGGVLLLYAFRGALLLFVLSLAIAAVFRPAVLALRERRFPGFLAILLPYIIVLGLLGLLIFVYSQPVASELQKATDNFATQYTHIKDTWSQMKGFQGTIASQMPPLEQLYKAITGEQGSRFLGLIVGVATNFISLLSSLGLIILLSIYWSVDRVYFERLWLSFLPVDQRRRWRAIWRETESGMGSYIRSEFLQMIAVAILLSLLYRLLGLPYPTLLALFGGLVWLVPWLGAVLAVIPPLLVGWLSGSVILGVFSALVTLGVLLLFELIVEPRIFNRGRYSSLLIVLFMIALVDVYGLFGLLIAPPLAAATQIIFSHILPQPVTPTLVTPTEQLQRLRLDLIRVREMAVAFDEPPEIVASLTQRLDRLIDQAEVTVAGNGAAEEIAENGPVEEPAFEGESNGGSKST